MTFFADYDHYYLSWSSHIRQASIIHVKTFSGSLLFDVFSKRIVLRSKTWRGRWRTAQHDRERCLAHGVRFRSHQRENGVLGREIGSHCELCGNSIRGSGGRTRIAADRTGETISTGDLEQDGTGNDEEGTGDDGTSGSTVLTGRRKLLTRRRQRVCKQFSALVQGKLQDDKNHLSYLELSSAMPAVIAAYTNEPYHFAKHKASPVIENLPDVEVDQLLVDWAHWLFFQAYHSSTLDRFMAAFLFKHPDFLKTATEKSQDSGGYHRDSTRGRQLEPENPGHGESSARSQWSCSSEGISAWAYWCALCSVNTSDPVKHLASVFWDWAKTLRGMGSFYSLALNPSEEGGLSKTGFSDESVLWDVPYRGWVPKVTDRFSVGMAPHERSFSSVSEMNISVERLLLPRLVPYQARHSDASWDRVNCYRDQLQIQKRSRWRSTSSMIPCEKAGPVAQAYQRLQQQHSVFYESSADWRNGSCLKVSPLPKMFDASPPFPPSTTRRVTGLVWDLFSCLLEPGTALVSLVRVHHYVSLFLSRRKGY